MKTTDSEEKDIAALRDLIADIRFAMVTAKPATSSRRGCMTRRAASRPMPRA